MPTNAELIRHWLLNLAVEMPVWLYCLFPVVELEALNVKSIPHCSPSEYARGLLELCESGMISVRSELPEDDVKSRSGVSQILDRFLALLRDDSKLRERGRLLRPYERNRIPTMRVSFDLTRRGGETWEGVAHPDWSHIFTERRDSMSGELISPNRDLLMAYMGWYPELHKEEIKLETVTWQTRSNFRILYWKALPLVHHVTFMLQPSRRRRPVNEPKWFQDWWISSCQWHKEPWELADWPSE